MKLRYDPRAWAFLESISEKDRSKALEYILLFEEYGFSLNSRYLKKVEKNIWELRPKRIRLFLYMRESQPFLIHASYKKTQKTARKDLKTIKDRIKQYI